MVFLLRTLLRAVKGDDPKLVCSGRLWNRGVNELRRRAGGRRESGAFLLGTTKGNTRRIRQFLFYDDVDATCFKNGIVEFDGSKFGIVWQKCRDLKMTVVADVHVHPCGFGQSWSDRDNPMIPNVGHLAVILPDYAARGRMPGGIGIYEYLGSRRWLDYSPQGAGIFHVGLWPK
jgi:proteasome lid subunit RPN8/RPN11